MLSTHFHSLPVLQSATDCLPICYLLLANCHPRNMDLESVSQLATPNRIKSQNVAQNEFQEAPHQAYHRPASHPHSLSGNPDAGITGLLDAELRHLALPRTQAPNCLKTYKYDKRYGNNAIGHFHYGFHMISHLLSYDFNIFFAFLLLFSLVLQGGPSHAKMKHPSETSPGMLARLPEIEQKHNVRNTK